MSKLSNFAKIGVGKPIHTVYMAIKKPLQHIQHFFEAKKIDKQLKADKKLILYCGVCETSNMGDLAQTFCTHKWLSENYPDHKVIDCRTNLIMDGDIFLNTIKQRVSKETLFFFQSGYNTHDLGGREDLMHQRIISSFPQNTMIMLPQTVYFKSEERKRQCSNVYDAHNRLLFFARDYESERLAKEMFPSLQVKFLPDIVSSLIGRFNFHQVERDGLLLCRRHDIEQFYTEDNYIEIERILKVIEKTDVEDTILSDSNKKIYADIEGYIRRIVEHFASYNLIVTDKFHGIIFSLIANTPVIILRTKDHKVTGGYELFHEHFPDMVFFADKIEKIEEITRKILERKTHQVLDTYYYDKYYKDLKKLIDMWMKDLAEV